MALRYEIDAQRKNIRVTAMGEVSPEDLVNLHHRFATTPEVRPDYSILFDLRHAEAPRDGFSSDGVRTLAALPNILSPAARRAVVVRTVLGFGIARMYGLRRGDRMTDFAVFRDLGEAECWIDRE
ncbi:MAG TPA: hypothetical protein VMI34_20380 [Candidatus Bathyarchaeia archaeon]|nr:hypothetical protein [Candidatus Bathyarchaeia archaeon]